MHDFVFATKGGTGIFSKLNVCQIALAKSSENSLSKEYDSDFCLWRLPWFNIGKGGGWRRQFTGVPRPNCGHGSFISMILS